MTRDNARNALRPAAARGRHRIARRERSAPRTFAVVATTMLLALLGALAVAGPASATVGEIPDANTPYLASPKSVITSLTYCGSTIYAVGDFTAIKQGDTTYQRGYGFAFDENTDKVLAFNPEADAPIYSIAMSPDCKYAYVGGRFSSVRGGSEQNLAKLGSVFGYADTSFSPNPDKQVNAVLVVNHGTQVIVGGIFDRIGKFGPGQFASVRPTNGYVTGYLNVPVTGTLPHAGGFPRINNMQAGNGQTQMLAEGNFTSVGGVAHQQIFELDLGSSAATLNAWSNSDINTKPCASDIPYYMRDAAYSPDGSTIYIATTGANGTSPFCDSVSAFTNTASATNLWINKTGQDSLYSVRASNTDVYVGGHERWANNPQGHNTCETTCVDRRGVGSIDPSTGLATEWNPGRTRGDGADDILSRPGGLYVASDNNLGSTRCHGEYHPGLCFFPGTP